MTPMPQETRTATSVCTIAKHVPEVTGATVKGEVSQDAGVAGAKKATSAVKDRGGRGDAAAGRGTSEGDATAPTVAATGAAWDGDGKDMARTSASRSTEPVRQGGWEYPRAIEDTARAE